MKSFFAVVLVFLILPATSIAQSSPRFRHAKDIGKQIYGPVCHGDVGYLERSLPGDQIGEAEWMIHGTTGNNPDDFFDCKIVINGNHHYSHSMYCAVVVHEWGHLAGLEHSSDPNSVMCEFISRRSIPYQCK